MEKAKKKEKVSQSSNLRNLLRSVHPASARDEDAHLFCLITPVRGYFIFNCLHHRSAIAIGL